jgi:Uma2 family endonuclease
MDIPRLTAEEFATNRADLPDGGRWIELVRGEPVTYPPPDPVHGNVVLHLGTAFGQYLERAGERATGYACFDLGLVVARHPDTVRFPAVSYFADGGSRFAMTDEEVTATRPALIVEIASGEERSRTLEDRIREYLAWGVHNIWAADTRAQVVHVLAEGLAPRLLEAADRLSDESVLPGFSISVADLFADPTWWRG